MNGDRVSDRLVEFDEGRCSEHVHPHAEGPVDFDWRVVEEALGEFPASEKARASEAIARLLMWMAEPVAACLQPGQRLSPKRAQIHIARVVIVLLWTVRPEFFGGLTIEKLAERLRVNVRDLRRIRADIRASFGELRTL